MNGKIAFTSNRTVGEGVNNPEGDDEIFTMNPDGTGLEQLTSNAASDSNPAWSADGARIAFESRRSGKRLIYVMNSDGSGVKRVTATTSWSPAFSPDGRRIVFLRDSVHADEFTISTMVASTGKPLKTIAGPSTADAFSWPVFSPDGKQIAYSQATFGPAAPWDLVVKNSNGEGVASTLIAQGGDADWAPLP